MIHYETTLATKIPSLNYNSLKLIKNTLDELTTRDEKGIKLNYAIQIFDDIIDDIIQDVVLCPDQRVIDIIYLDDVDYATIPIVMR